MPKKIKDNLLVLAPHTDDGEFGCGGTISKYTRDGWRVIYVAFSAAEESVPLNLPRDILRREVKTATAALGILPDDCIVLNFKVRRFPEYRQEILEKMVALGKEFSPSLVLMPSLLDTHQDHRVIAEEGFRAFKKTSILGYEAPWNNLEFKTSCFIYLDQVDLDAKIKALSFYESQSHRPYASREIIASQAAFRGVQISAKYAEAFEVIRWVIT